MPPPSPPDPNVATDEQEREVEELIDRVPEADCDTIMQAVIKIPALTDKQQVDLLTKRFREYLERKKPKPTKPESSGGR